MKTKALVVLSGGQDSTTCLGMAKKKYDEVHAITFDYGQRHAIEIEAAKKVAQIIGVTSHEIIKVPDCLVSTSPLTSNNELEQYENAEQMDKVIGTRVEKTFVPMRNTLFLTIAMNRAVALNCDTIMTGICQEDNANYPDCTEAFRDAFEYAANISLFGHKEYIRPEIVIAAPLMWLSKAETCSAAYQDDLTWLALAYSHTSYDGKFPPVDMNHSNVLRAKGFEDANLPDPLVVRAHYFGLMEFPDTENYNDGKKIEQIITLMKKLPFFDEDLANFVDGV